MTEYQTSLTNLKIWPETSSQTNSGTDVWRHREWGGSLGVDTTRSWAGCRERGREEKGPRNCSAPQCDQFSKLPMGGLPKWKRRTVCLIGNLHIRQWSRKKLRSIRRKSNSYVELAFGHFDWFIDWLTHRTSQWSNVRLIDRLFE